MLLRETLGKWVSGWFLGLGWFWAIWDRDAQAWHDKIAGTVVLYRRSQTRKHLAFLLVFGLPVLSVGFLWASLITRTGFQGGGEGIAMLPNAESKQPSQEAAAVRVPFVGCNSDGQSGPVPAPQQRCRVPILPLTLPSSLLRKAGDQPHESANPFRFDLPYPHNGAGACLP